MEGDNPIVGPHLSDDVMISCHTEYFPLGEGTLVMRRRQAVVVEDSDIRNIDS